MILATSKPYSAFFGGKVSNCTKALSRLSPSYCLLRLAKVEVVVQMHKTSSHTVIPVGVFGLKMLFLTTEQNACLQTKRTMDDTM